MLFYYKIHLNERIQVDINKHFLRPHSKTNSEVQDKDTSYRPSPRPNLQVARGWSRWIEWKWYICNTHWLETENKRMVSRGMGGGGMGEKGEGNWEKQTSRYKIKTSWGCNVQRRECSQQRNNFIQWQVVTRVIVVITVR